MKRKFGLQVKFTLFFLGFMLAITAAVLLFTENNNQMLLDEKYHDYAVSIAKLTASMISGEEVRYYKEKLEPDEAYGQVLQELQRIQRQTNIYYLYVICPVSENEGIYIYDVALEEEEPDIGGEQVHRLGESVSLEGGYEGAKQVMLTGTASQEFEYDGKTEDETEGLASAYAPIRDEKGNTVAFVGVDMDIKTIRESVNQARNRMMGTLFILMGGCFVFLILIVQFWILKPIRKLKRYAERLSEGTFGNELPVRGHDEISEITGVFNRMSKNIQGHMEEIKGINRGYQKYVPSELLTILEKESITQMELGNQVSRFVTVMSFQRMEPEEENTNRDSREIMESMNFLFRSTIPVIMEQKGFVERFQDTGMLAVYPQGTEDAVISAISICQKMNRYQKREGEAPPKFSMGIAYGGVLFGNVGYDERMATISISAYTSMARYLQKLAPRYGSRLLITSGAVEQIPGFSQGYHYRFIGMVENKYNKTVEKIYDIYDGDTEEQREGKERTKAQFEKGVELFCMHRFRESRQAFIGVLKRFRKDAGAKRYLQACNRYYQMEQTEELSVFMTE